MSAKRPTAVTVATRTRRYDSPTQVTAPTDALKVCCRVGSATVTIEASSCPMNAPTQTAATANQWASGCSRIAAGRLGSTKRRSQVHVHGLDGASAWGGSPVTRRTDGGVPDPSGLRVGRRGAEALFR